MGYLAAGHHLPHEPRRYVASAACEPTCTHAWRVAAYFEQGEYDKCIEACNKAVDEGRSLRADFKLIAKALGRTGNAYAKKGDLETAIKFYNKSLTEHRTPDILAKLHEAERTQAEAARLAYIDPEKAAQAREEGNALFHKGDFAGAVKAYTEAIKRAPDDPRGYNNRANAYTKLAALPEALKDAEQAIKVDPKFVKAYIRKSHVLFAMRDYTKAIEAVQQAADVDTDQKHAKEIREQVMKCERELYNQRAGESEEETLERAMRDPEVAVRARVFVAERQVLTHCEPRKSWATRSCSPSSSRRRRTRPRCRTT